MVLALQPTPAGGVCMRFTFPFILLVLSTLAYPSSTKELYSGEALAERYYLWGSYYIGDDSCQNAPLNEDTQKKLCAEPTLATEVEQGNRERRLACEEAGGIYEVKTDEKRVVKTQRNIVPVVCKVTCQKVSKYSCRAKEFVEPVANLEWDLEKPIPAKPLAEAGTTVAPVAKEEMEGLRILPPTRGVASDLELTLSTPSSTTSATYQAQ